MEDIPGAKIVEVQIRTDGKVLWVNVDGICALRVCNIENVSVDDMRSLQAKSCEFVEDEAL